MTRALVHSLAFSIVLLASPVFAGDLGKPSYSAEDVVASMIAQADMGAARGICIGTPSECNASRPKPRGFDMLVSFDLDSAELLPEAMANLKTVAVALNDDRLKVAMFKVEGHTDALGSDDYNQHLSDARAKAVADFLVSQNVAPERIVATGLGKTAPRTDNPYDPENRRVELSLSLN